MSTREHDFPFFNEDPENDFPFFNQEFFPRTFTTLRTRMSLRPTGLSHPGLGPPKIFLVNLGSLIHAHDPQVEA